MSTDENDAEKYYKKTQEIIGMIVSNLDWLKLCNELKKLDNPVIQEQDLQIGGCGVSYMKKQVGSDFQITTEGAAWTTALFLMCWSLYNFKNKTSIGHCHNPNHKHPCKEGSDFHYNLYKECLKSFKDLIQKIEADQPKPV
jgi:hypothetical protein